MNIKIYIIHLKHKTTLKTHILSQLENISIEYEFIDGVYGKEISQEYFKNNNISVDKSFRNPFTDSSITMGEIGCSLSHYNAWKKAQSDNVQYPIIIEDDAIINNDIKIII